MRSWSGKRKDAKEVVADEFDRLQDEFDTLRTKLTRFAGDTVKEFNDAPHKFSELRDSVEGRLAILESDIGALSRQLRVRGNEAADQVKSTVHERPFTSLAVAFGVGIVAAQLLRRRSRS